MARRARPVPPAPGLTDHVERLVQEWLVERPDLDVAPIAVVYRVLRLAGEWRTEVDKVFARFGITSTDFAVLANLRRAGAPYQLTQRQLMAALRLTSGTLSVRTDKLVERGLVERQRDPDDARATRVTLTAAGHAMFDAVAPAHLANEARLVAALSTEEQSTLGQLLRVLLVDIEQPDEARPDDVLGLRVAPAAEAQERRAAVGLGPAPGLLVEDVRANGPAAAAGIRIGDLLVTAGDLSLRSLTCLQRALDAGAAPLAFTVQRANRTLRVELPVDAGRRSP